MLPTSKVLTPVQMEHVILLIEDWTAKDPRNWSVLFSCALVISYVLNIHMFSRERAYSSYWCTISILLMMTSSNEMKTFSRYWPFVRGIHRSPVNSPYKGQWRGALMFILICTWINGWVNNRETGDSRRHCAHYDVIVMFVYHITDAWRFDQRWLLHNTPGDWFTFPV